MEQVSFPRYFYLLVDRVDESKKYMNKRLYEAGADFVRKIYDYYSGK